MTGSEGIGSAEVGGGDVGSGGSGSEGLRDGMPGDGVGVTEVEGATEEVDEVVADGAGEPGAAADGCVLLEGVEPGSVEPA